jgi:hypothetical protein
MKRMRGPATTIPRTAPGTLTLWRHTDDVGCGGFR